MAGLQDLADGLASQLGRSVTVVDSEIRILCASAHFGDEDDARVHAILQRVAIPEVYRHIHAHDVRRWTGAGHVAAADELGFKRRLVIPVRRGAVLLALVMIIDAPGEELGPAATAAAVQVAALMAAPLDEERAGSERHRVRRRQLIEDLLDEHEATRERAVATAESFASPSDHLSVGTLVVLPVAGPGAGRALSGVVEAGVQNLAALERSQLDCVADGRTATLVSVTSHRPGPDEVDALARRVLQSVESLLGVPGCCVLGLAAGPARLSGMRRARRQSRLAAEAATLLPRFRPVARFSDLGSFAALLRVPRDELGDAVAAGVHRLVEHDPRLVLRTTLEAYLDEACSAPATAERLHLHRTSLYYRLRQIEERTGLSLRRGDDRLTLHLSLRALELLDAVTVSDL